MIPLSDCRSVLVSAAGDGPGHQAGEAAGSLAAPSRPRDWPLSRGRPLPGRALHVLRQQPAGLSLRVPPGHRHLHLLPLTMDDE